MTPGPVGTEPAPIPDSATQHMVRMRDGVLLATDVYLPDGDRPVPAILVRLPYDKNSRYVFMEAVARRATAAGYALVVQDVRGKYRSGGEPLGPLNESRDGYDTLQWLSSVDWCTGRVGMFGDSYYGFTQWAAVSSGHPALKAIVPRVTSMRLPQFERAESDNVRDIHWMTFGTYMMNCWTGPHVNDQQPDLSLRPLTAAFDAGFDALGERSAWFDSMIPRVIPLPVYPDGHPTKARAVPTLHCVGWWDNVLIPSMRDYEELCAVPDWGPLQYLWADSTDHENYHLSEVGTPLMVDHDVDDDAVERLMEIYITPALRFFDVFVKGDADPDDHPRVQYHVGHSGYRTSTSWPPPDSRVSSLFLRDLDQATTTGGRLDPTPSEAEERGEWAFEPSDLIPAAAENSWAFLFEFPDESATALRGDVAVFDGDPVTDEVVLAGPVALHLRVGSTAASADVLVKLTDVAPDGTSHMIARGQGEILRPDAETPTVIRMGHTAYSVRVGHRLRVQVASSEFPEFPPNPGDGSNRWLATTFHRARHSILSSASDPARLDITVLPRTEVAG